MTERDPLATFYQEVDDLLGELETVLLDLESRPEDPNLIDRAFRALHTLKGSGGAFGFDDLAEFVHDMETAFDAARKGRLATDRRLIDLGLGALDHMRTLVKEPEAADPVRGDMLSSALRNLTDSAGRRDGADEDEDGEAAHAASAQAASQTPHTYRITLSFDQEVMKTGNRPLRLLDELCELGHADLVAETAAVPDLGSIDPEGCYLTWQILLTTTAGQEAIEDVFLFVSDNTQLHIEALGPLDSEDARRLGEVLVERGHLTREDVDQALAHQRRLGEMLVESGHIDEGDLSAALVEQRHRRAAAESLGVQEAKQGVRVSTERLDTLMDLVGELVIAQARLSETARETGFGKVASVAEDIERLSDELRDVTMTMRLVPIGTLFARVRRLVRDVAQDLGKQVELIVDGEETELDKTVIERLQDPLTHLVRNAIDHGIETPAERLALNKPEAGHIYVGASQSGGRIQITLHDDGRGLDREAIAERGKAAGLIDEGSALSDRDLLDLIFQPGFSTSREVSHLSGRGVGMDVVKRGVDALRGRIDLDTTSGEGTTITLSLPMTLAIIDGLLVRTGDSRFVLPLSAVEECVELRAADDRRSSGRAFLNLRGDLVPYVRLWELFGFEPSDADPQKVAIVSNQGRRVGFVVDQVIGQYQTVIKSLSALHRDVAGFSGATILGDGSVALILDVAHLITFAQAQEEADRTARETSPAIHR